MTTTVKPSMPGAMMRIRGSTAFRNLHRFLLRASGGRIGSRINGMDTLLLATTGRKSGGSERSHSSLCLTEMPGWWSV